MDKVQMSIFKEHPKVKKNLFWKTRTYEHFLPPHDTSLTNSFMIIFFSFSVDLKIVSIPALFGTIDFKYSHNNPS